jgi:hypothetical protein
MNKRLREATEPIEVTQPFKRNRPVEMQTITLFLGAHGSDPDIVNAVKLRSSNPHLYDDGFTVNFLSFAGLANIKTLVGLVFVREPPPLQATKIKNIETSGYDKYNLFDDLVANQLNGLGTDHVALSYLVPRIFKDKIIDTQSESISVIDDMKNEMWALGMLADIEYSKLTPPKRIENPPFEKWWWFDNNPGDDLRRFDTKKRTGIARAAGNTEDNPILSTNGLFILHTTNDEHSPFSISNIHERDYEFANKKDGLRIITPVAIKRRNLLRKINYTSYWKKWIEAFDFSGVPDDDVLKIGSIEEAVFIVKQIYYAFRSKNATDDPAELDGVDEYEEEYTKTGEEVEEPVAECKLPALSLSLSQTIINQLNTRILPQADKATSLNILIKRANEDVQTQRDTFFRAAEAADELEKQINERTRQRQLRSDTPQIAVLTEELALADKELEGLRGELTKAMNHAAELNSELDKSKGIIGAGVTEFIRHLISQPVPEEVKAAIKNIIMRNKLKNILKFGIFHKRLSLSQVILFFRSLGYNIINIVDPSCFVLKAPRPLKTDIDSQILSGSQEDIVEPKSPPLDWCEELTMLVGLLEGDVPMPSASTASANGIAKREKTKGSLKSLSRSRKSLSRKSLSRKSLSRHRMSSRTGGTTQRRRRQKRRNF